MAEASSTRQPLLLRVYSCPCSGSSAISMLAPLPRKFPHRGTHGVLASAQSDDKLTRHIARFRAPGAKLGMRSNKPFSGWAPRLAVVAATFVLSNRHCNRAELGQRP
jgi:hypothetical protein